MSGERAVNKGQPDVAGGLPSERVATSKTLRDTAIRDLGMRKLWRNSGKMKNAPAGAATPDAGGDHAPPTHEIEGEVPNILPSLAGLTDSERYKHLIGALDDVHGRVKAVLKEQDALMVFARDNGVSCHEIAIVLEITESGVRARLRKVRGGDA